MDERDSEQLSTYKNNKLVAHHQLLAPRPPWKRANNFFKRERWCLSLLVNTMTDCILPPVQVQDEHEFNTCMPLSVKVQFHKKELKLI